MFLVTVQQLRFHLTADELQRTHDVQEVFSQDCWSSVDGFTRTIKHTTCTHTHTHTHVRSGLIVSSFVCELESCWFVELNNLYTSSQFIIVCVSYLFHFLFILLGSSTIIRRDRAEVLSYRMLETISPDDALCSREQVTDGVSDSSRWDEVTWVFTWVCQCVVPSMSSETGVRKMSPVNSQLVFLASMPDVPSNTCRGQNGAGQYIMISTGPQLWSVSTHLSISIVIDRSVFPPQGTTEDCTWTTALEPVTSRTCPLLLVPSGSVRWTISAYLGNCWEAEDGSETGQRRVRDERRVQKC